MSALPRTPKGRATRERIVGVAQELVYEQGVRATTLDDIGERAGVSRSQLYHYFDDKADLIRAVVERAAARVLQVQAPYLEHVDDWAGIEAWFDALVALQDGGDRGGGCPIGSLVPQLADHDEEARAALVAAFGRWQAPLAAGLASMRERGLLRPDADPGHLATATLAAIQGGLLLIQTRRDSEPLRAALDAALVYLRHHAAG